MRNTWLVRSWRCFERLLFLASRASMTCTAFPMTVGKAFRLVEHACILPLCHHGLFGRRARQNVKQETSKAFRAPLAKSLARSCPQIGKQKWHTLQACCASRPQDNGRDDFLHGVGRVSGWTIRQRMRVFGKGRGTKRSSDVAAPPLHRA